MFIDCQGLIGRLRKTYNKGNLERGINHDESNLLFQLINSRYERHSTIITSNSDLSSWLEIFQNPTVTKTILDRLVSHVRSCGKDYR